MPEKEFAAYLTTSVKNSCISFLRKRREDTVSIEEHSASTSCMPDEATDEGEKSPEEILQSALATLPPKCKEIFLLSKLQGLKYREIAGKLSLSEKTVENQMTKAIKLLRVYVAEHSFLLITVVAVIVSIIINCE